MNYEELIEKWGGLNLKFENYYKYTFTYTGKFGDKEVTVRAGGDGDDIYRWEIGPTETLESLGLILSVKIGEDVIYEKKY